MTLISLQKFENGGIISQLDQLDQLTVLVSVVTKMVTGCLRLMKVAILH